MSEPVVGELVRKTTRQRPSLRTQRKPGELSYTKEVGKAVVDSVRGGLPIKFAAQFHRIPEVTVRSWLQYGDEHPTTERGVFATEVRQAQAAFVAEMVEGVKAAGFGSAKQWAALMTLLERLYPEDFRRPTERSENLHLHGFVDERIHELIKAGEISYDGS